MALRCPRWHPLGPGQTVCPLCGDKLIQVDDALLVAVAGPSAPSSRQPVTHPAPTAPPPPPPRLLLPALPPLSAAALPHVTHDSLTELPVVSGRTGQGVAPVPAARADRETSDRSSTSCPSCGEVTSSRFCPNCGTGAPSDRQPLTLAAQDLPEREFSREIASPFTGIGVKVGEVGRTVTDFARHRPMPAAVVGLVVIILLAFAFMPAGVTGGSRHALTGTFTISGFDSIAAQGGTAQDTIDAMNASLSGQGVNPSYSNCSSGPGGGYSDIKAGTGVTITDGLGRVVATSTLTSGVQGANGCSFNFTSTVPDSDFYKIEVSRRGAQSYSRQELSQRGWRVGLTLG